MAAELADELCLLLEVGASIVECVNHEHSDRNARQLDSEIDSNPGRSPRKRRARARGVKARRGPSLRGVI